jgi:hypothetical protein
MKKRAVLLLLIALLSLLTVTGCTSAPGPNADDPEIDVEDSEETVVIHKYEYHLFQDTVEYVSEEEKESWRPHLLRRFSYIQHYTDQDVPEGEYAIGVHDLYALFDVNLDGVPEILGGLSNSGSGCAPVYPYAFTHAYDLYTGKELDTHISFSITDGTAVYYDVELGFYKIFSVNYESTRSGMERVGGRFSIERVETLYEGIRGPYEGDFPCLATTTYLSTGNSGKAMISDETDADDPDSHRIVWLYNEPSYTKDGKPCTYFEFFRELTDFTSNQILIPSTRLQYVQLLYGAYGTTAEDILAGRDQAVDDLLSSGQQFVRPIVREEADTSEATE